MEKNTLSTDVILASGTEKEIQKQLDRIKNLSVEIQHASLNPNVIKNLQKQLSGQALSVKVETDIPSASKNLGKMCKYTCFNSDIVLNCPSCPRISLKGRNVLAQSANKVL